MNQNNRLKFRIWKLERYSYQNGCDSLGEHLMWANKNTIGLDPKTKKPKFEEGIIQQYIGLKDRDGKEIYEGDILYSFHGEAVHTEVIYNKGDEETDNFGILDDRWCYKYPNGNINFLNAYRAKRLKIVGNVFENKELLCEK